MKFFQNQPGYENSFHVKMSKIKGFKRDYA